VFWSRPAERRGLLGQAVCKWVLAVAVGTSLAVGTAVDAKSPAPAAGAVALAQLPEPAQQTYRRVLSNGPFPYQKDGVVFGNRERRLPAKSRGYYREYTVETPGSADRGARRIVCGGTRPAEPEACYYTADHYASFSRIVP